jgi:hypothetical protein
MQRLRRDSRNRRTTRESLGGIARVVLVTVL